MDTATLVEFGLTDAEATIYLSLLKLGPATIRDIAKDCGFHRTNIYDIAEQLKEKGLVAYAKEGKKTIYRASDPKNLYAILDEKREILDKAFPAIMSMHERARENVETEVYKGEQGMKASFRDMIRSGKPVQAFGVKGQLREKLPIFAAQWLRDMREHGIPYYGIYTKREEPPSYYTEIRYVPDELSGPVATFIYGDTVNVNIWEPSLIAIVIRSKAVAESYRKHFELLWTLAKA